MANTVIKLKKSSVPSQLPTSTQLEYGEIAINYADGKIFYKDPSNNIQQISGSANTFYSVNANGTLLVSTSPTDILTINPGNNIEITSNFLTDTLTIGANLKFVYDVANAAFDVANNGSGASINIGASPPPLANAGALWWSTETGRLYIYYVDVDSNQWVETSPSGGFTEIAEAYNTVNAAFTVANAAFNAANTAGGSANLEPVFVVANAAFDKANTVALDLANTAIAANNYAGAMANAANAYAASLTPDLSPSFTVANAAFAAANQAGVIANAAFGVANTALPNTSGAVFEGNLNIKTDLYIGNNITNVSSILFNTSTNRTPSIPGELTWSQDESTLRFNMDTTTNVIAHIGQDLYYLVKNQTGSTINKGTVVRFDGTLGSSGRLLIAPAIANNSYPSKYVMGVAATNISDGDDGYVLAQGKLRGINTSSFSAGDILYVSPSTAGAFANTMPTAPNNKITIAAVVHSHPSSGVLEVRLTLGSKLNEDELVEFGPLANGQILTYVSANGRFENSNVLISAYTTLNAAFGVANGAYTSTNGAAAFAAANQAGVVANNANIYANTTYVKKAGDTITGDLVVQGNLTTSGVVTYANTQTLLIGDSLITLNNDIPVGVAPSENAGIEVKRGSSANVALLWNEGTDRWTFTNDGTNYRLIASNTDVESANNYAGAMANSGNSWTQTIVDANLVTARAYTNTSTTAANNYAGVMANSANAIAIATFGTITNTTAAFAAANQSGVIANAAFTVANAAFGSSNTRLANTSGVSFNGSLFFPTGNVGIGTTTPSANLHIVGSANISLNLRIGANLTFDNTDSVRLMEPTANTLTFVTTSNEAMRIDSTGNVGIGLTSPIYRLHVNGSFAANTKSFVIDHPTKSGMKLRYGSLEGPENGVYVRGKINGYVIELPDYWTGLVDEDTITVQLTAIGETQSLHVVEVTDNKVIICGENGLIPYCYYTVYGERKDVGKLIVEY